MVGLFEVIHLCTIHATKDIAIINGAYILLEEFEENDYELIQIYEYIIDINFRYFNLNFHFFNKQFKNKNLIVF